jgi:hypothetical protein
MKVLDFTISHADLEALMGQQRLVRLFSLEDRGRERDHYRVTALVREEHVSEVIGRSAERPRWVR